LAGFASNVQNHGTDASTASVTVSRWSNDVGASRLMLGKSRGGLGAYTAVQNNDEIGAIEFCASDGTDLATRAASIGVAVDGTPGSNDMPGRLVFSTTADGASSPTERMRIQSGGYARFGGFILPATGADNTYQVGASGERWSAIWAANGTIQTSDKRAKKDIAASVLGSEFIKQLNPISYKWIEGGKIETDQRNDDNTIVYESVPGTRTHWGFIAQEVKEAVDAAGVDFGGWVLTDKDDPDSQQALRYDQFIAPLTKALQETMAELEALKAEVAALKAS